MSGPALTQSYATRTMALEVLLVFSQNGITWQVSLRPDLRQGDAVHIVEFRKSGKHGNLLDQVIGWRPAGWCSAPSSKIPKYLLERIAAQLQQRLANEAQGEEAQVRAQLLASPAGAATVARLRFPGFLSAELLAAHCPEYHRRHSAAAER